MRETTSFHAVHPGASPKEELAMRGLSAAAFALLLPRAQTGDRPETALRIGLALRTAGRLWRAMQQAYDLRKTEIAMGDTITAEVQSAA